MKNIRITALVLVFAVIIGTLAGCARTSEPQTISDGTTEYENTEAESENETLPSAETVIIEETEETEEETEEETTAHSHSYTKGETKEPTCSSEGYEVYTCGCGDSYTTALAAKDHSFQAVVTAPTDYDQGYTVMVCSACGYSDGTRTNVVSANLSDQEIILRLVNEERTKAGLSALEYRYDLQEAANIRAAECKVFLSHTRPDGRSCSTVFEDIGKADELNGGGENLAYGYFPAKYIFQGWMESEGHRANIMKDNYTGIVIAVLDNSYWVQLFVY